MMENNIHNAASTDHGQSTISSSPRKRRPPEVLRSEELDGLPGAKLIARKEPYADKHYLFIRALVTGPYGKPDEIQACHSLASTLHAQSEQNGVGKMSAINIANGVVEIVLSLNVTEKPVSNSDPIRRAFEHLSATTQAAPPLQHGKGSWVGKLNGSTIISGDF